MKRLPFIRTGRTHQSHLRSRSNATFYSTDLCDNRETDLLQVSSVVHNEAKLMKTLQVPNVAEAFPVVSHPHLDRETCPWEIDSARTSALAQIKSDFRSKSTGCLVREGDNPDENHSPVSNLKIIVQKVRRKSQEVEAADKTEKKKLKKTSLTGGLHRRCHSAVGLSRQDAFDWNDEERNRAAAFAALKYIQKNNNVYSSAESALVQNQEQQHQQPEERSKDKSNTLPRQVMHQSASQPSPKSSKSNTFPRQMTLHSSSPTASSQANMGKKFMKSMSLMSSPVKHFSHFLSPPSRINELTSSTRYITYVPLTATTTPVLLLRSVLPYCRWNIFVLQFVPFCLHSLSYCSISFFSFSPKLILQWYLIKHFIFVPMVSRVFFVCVCFCFVNLMFWASKIGLEPVTLKK